MNCIRCERNLPNVSSDPELNQPMGGTEFITQGNYGSAVTDYMDGTEHIINVCDDCLRAALERGHCRVFGVARSPIIRARAAAR